MSLYDDAELYLYPNRTLCSILDDLRSMHKTHNYSCLLACAEEIQYHANRMEAGLADMKDIREIRNKLTELKTEYRKEKNKIKTKKEKK